MSEQTAHVTPPVTLDQVKARATECGKEITALGKQVHSCDLKVARLLMEAMDGKYAQALGLAKFEDWLVKYTEFGKPSHAYGLIKIVRGADALGIDPAALEPVPTVKLKHIFGLDGATHGADIKKLLAKCAKQGAKFQHEKVKAECDRIKGGGTLDESGDSTAAPSPVTVTVKFTLSESDNAALQAALKATNQQNPNTALLAIANAYMVFLTPKVTVEPPPAEMAMAA